MATHVTPALFDFLFDLDVHNERSWFDANRDRYETVVREPLLAFVRDVERPLRRKVSRHLVADARKQGGSLFRIHRDMRFAKDQRPYKTNAALQFRHEQGRDVHAPSLYLHFEPGNCFAGAGMWRPDTATLNRVRDRMVADPGAYKRLRTRLGKTGWTFGGESLARGPKGYDRDHELIDDLCRTSFMLTRSFTEEEASAEDFLDRYVAWAAETRPALRYLGRALDLPV